MALRLATQGDAPAIADLMRASAEALFPQFYGEQEAASGAIYIAQLDPLLIDDGTYFVHEEDGEIVACGGWSRRAKLYTGSGPAGDDARVIDPASEPARVRAMFVRSDWTRRGLGRAILEASEAAARDEGFTSLTLVATLAGEPLYRAFGFTEVERIQITMPDGVTSEGVLMERPVQLG
jgi:N-acetylglutamate synthase-like GNAT family acetyltransferase